MARDPGNFDPLRSNEAFSSVVMANVLDPLFEIDKEGNVVGRLVERTENPQPEVYVFTIRRGVKFHDGTDLDGEAVRLNLQRHLDDPTSVRFQSVRDVASIELLASHTVKVTLKTPFAPFTGALAGGAGYIVSPTAIQRLGDSLQRDLTGAGSGAFKFVEWKRDTHVILERNPAYWRMDADGTRLPYLDRIIFKPLPDENVRLTNVKTGDADVLIQNPPYKDVAALKRDGELVINELPGIGFSLFILNTAREPFNHPAARRAYSYAIDRAQIQKVVFLESGRALDTPVPESIPWAHDHANHPYLARDLAKARQELAAAGKPGGFTFTLLIGNNSPVQQQLAELVKDQVKEVGLELDIQLLDFGTVIANGAAGEFQMIALDWSGDLDPDTIYPLFSTNAAFNYTRYGNPELDRLLAAGRSTLDQARRAEFYKQAQTILFEDQPMVVYWNGPQILTTRKSVQSYPLTYNGYWGSRDFDRVWKSD
jgi:peptide/nickel transport system substrate-binding protein